MLATEALVAQVVEAPDPAREAASRLAERLPLGEESQVLADFVEDDLREGLAALVEVEAHFTDLMDLLRTGRLSPVSLLEAADDFRALNRLEYLMVVVAQLRRRFSQAAGRMVAAASARQATTT